MNAFTLAGRRLFKPGEHTISKLLTLSLGFAVSLLLLSIVIFQYSFERDYPEYERICKIQTNYKMRVSKGQAESNVFSQVSGAVAPAMQEEIPDVEMATRYTTTGDLSYVTENNASYKGYTFYADDKFFEVFDVPLLAGDRASILKDRTKCLVSESFAQKMGGDVLGKRISPRMTPGVFITIEGVYKDFPKNSEIKGDVILCILNLGEKSLNNWMGNDRYRGYVRLRKGVKPESLKEAIWEMQKRHQDMEAMKKSDLELHYELIPISRLRFQDPTLVNMVRIQEIVGIAVLLISLLNYVLMTIASMVNRRKGAAIRKCYGATSLQIERMMIWETFIYLFIALFLAVILLAAFNKPLESLTSVPLLYLISWRLAFVLIAVLTVSTFVMGWLPGWVLSKTPVMNIFRKSAEHNRTWKLSLLFVEIMASAFLIGMLTVTGMQYRHMVIQDAGYQVKGLYFTELRNIDKEKLPTIIDQLKKIPGFEGYSLTTSMPASPGQSGDNLSDPVSERELINVADLFDVDEYHFDLYKFKLLEGRKFDAATVKGKEIMVSRKSAETVAEQMGWQDGVVGKEIFLSSYGKVTIRGVYEDILVRRAHLSPYPEKMASVMVYGDEWILYLTARFDRMDGELMAEINDILQQADPYKETTFEDMEAELLKRFDAAKTFRNTILFGSAIAILIALVGLIGYVNTEVNRRRKELAIRKINGAGAIDIYRLFVLDIFKISIPAVLVGLIATFYFGANWLEKFNYRISLTIWPFLAVGLLVMLIIIAAVVFNVRRLIRQNPVESIKYE